MCCTWTPGVEQQVQVSAGVPFAPDGGVAAVDLHIRPILAHDGVGRRRDAHRHHAVLQLHDLPVPLVRGVTREGHCYHGPFGG